MAEPDPQVNMEAERSTYLPRCRATTDRRGVFIFGACLSLDQDLGNLKAHEISGLLYVTVYVLCTTSENNILYSISFIVQRNACAP